MRAFLLGVAGGVAGTLVSIMVANSFHEWERRKTAERILAGQEPDMKHRKKAIIAVGVLAIAGYLLYRWVA